MILALALSLPPVAGAEEGAATAEPPATGAAAAPSQRAPAGETGGRESADPARKPVYHPPRRGTPARRVSGSVRGAEGVLPELRVLVPEHVGQTVDDAPSLFWYVDGPLDQGVRFEFTLVDEDRIVPILERSLPPPRQAGIYRVRLADLGLKLDRGGRYQWSIAIVRDAAQRSHDVLASGFIERVDRPAGLVESAQGYAEQGLWYDALGVLGDEIERNPDDPAARAARDALLEQVGLEIAADGVSR